MTTDGALKDDVKLPEGEIGQQIQDAFSEGKDLIITVLSAMGEEQVYPHPTISFILYSTHFF